MLDDEYVFRQATKPAILTLSFCRNGCWCWNDPAAVVIVYQVVQNDFLR